MVCDQTDRNIIHCIHFIFLAGQLTYSVTDCFHCIDIKYGIYILHDNCKTLKSHTCINVLLGKFGVTTLSISLKLGKYVVPYFHETITVTSYFTVRFATAVFFSAVIVNLRTWTARAGTVLPEVITLSGFRIAVKSCDSLCRNSDFFCPDIECFIILAVNGWIQSVLL